jgi:hypothetical protein
MFNTKFSDLWNLQNTELIWFTDNECYLTLLDISGKGCWMSPSTRAWNTTKVCLISTYCTFHVKILPLQDRVRGTRLSVSAVLREGGSKWILPLSNVKTWAQMNVTSRQAATGHLNTMSHLHTPLFNYHTNTLRKKIMNKRRLFYNTFPPFSFPTWLLSATN